jgi:hypothetical protein
VWICRGDPCGRPPTRRAAAQLLFAALASFAGCCGPQPLDGPVQPAWNGGQPLPEPLRNIQAASLGDTAIIVAGGLDTSGAPSRRAYLYRHTGNFWSRIADLPARRRLGESGCERGFHRRLQSRCQPVVARKADPDVA